MIGSYSIKLQGKEKTFYDLNNLFTIWYTVYVIEWIKVKIQQCLLETNFFFCIDIY